MTAMMQWLEQKNPHVVGISLAMERSTYRLAMLRLDTLIDCGDTAAQVEPRLAPHIKSRAVQRAGLSYRPAAIGCPQHTVQKYIRQRGSRLGRFESIMVRHIELTVLYVVASWRNRHARSNLPLSHPAVKALIAQFEDWRRAIDAWVPRDALPQYASIWHRLTDKRYMRMPSPGELWAQDLILNHTVFTKNVADAAWYPNDPEQRRLKAKALADVTGLNNQRIAAFWASLLPPGGPARALAQWWDKHLECTAGYIDTLARTGDMSHDSEFDRAVMECIDRGVTFGGILDDYYGGRE
jgi:hypothetical protein